MFYYSCQNVPLLLHVNARGLRLRLTCASTEVRNKGGIVVRILHHVHQIHYVCIFVPMKLFGEKATWVHQAHDTEQLNLFNMMIGLTHHEKKVSCT